MADALADAMSIQPCLHMVSDLYDSNDLECKDSLCLCVNCQFTCVNHCVNCWFTVNHQFTCLNQQFTHVNWKFTHRQRLSLHSRSLELYKADY